MRFKTSQATEEFLEAVFARVGARNKAVLGRAGLMLAIGQGIPTGYRPADAQGVELNDETVLGDDLPNVVRAALNHRSGGVLDEAGYRQAFRTYFEYGCLRLKQMWDEVGGDQSAFVAALLKLSDLSAVDGALATGSSPGAPLSVVEHAVKLQLMEGEEPWLLNAAGGNSLLIVSGAPGRGKSQLVLDLLVQIARQGVRFLFLDLKGELEDSPTNPRQVENRKRFFDATGARYVRLITEGLPVNPLVRGSTTVENAQIASEIASLVHAFAPQLGAKQERVIRDAYETLEQPDFASLAYELEARGEQGVALAVIEKIAKFNLFARANNAVEMDQWLSRSQVIDFKPLANDNETKSLAVAMILNAITKRLNRNLPVKNAIQPLQMVLFVDEAHLLLPKEGKAGLLGLLARQGRSWGFPVWLASQDADAFLTRGDHATDFAELAESGIHFSPQSLTDTQKKKILGAVFSRQLHEGEVVIRRGTALSTGKARQFWRNRGEPPKA
jgi:hypothetical protein